MDEIQAIEAFAALAHPGRLEIFRRLVQAGPDGLAAGVVADEVKQKQNTASVNLTTLARAGLVASERHGREIRYRADYSAAGGLITFLLEDCCRGHADACAPAARSLASTGKRARAC